MNINDKHKQKQTNKQTNKNKHEQKIACSGLIEWMIINADDIINLSEKGVKTSAPLPVSATQEEKQIDENEEGNE